MPYEETAAGLAVRTLNGALAAINTCDHPAYVGELVGRFQGNVREALAAGDQLVADRAELRSKADLIPPAGAARLEREAQADAEANARSAMDRARGAVETLRRAALIEAMPQPSSEREALGRSELDMILGVGSPAEILARVHRVAESGSRDSLAVMLSPFGKSLLEAKGITGRDLDGALASARKVVVETAETNAHRHTPAEMKSAALYRATGEMDGAVAAAGFALSHIGLGHV